MAARHLRRLINTHSHSDHIGGNAALQRAFGCAIVIPAGIEAHVANWDEEALLLGPAAQRGDRFRHDGVIAPGEEFGMGGLHWQAIAAPGHGMEALVFHCPSERLLISGDALWQDGFGIVFGELLGQGGRAGGNAPDAGDAHPPRRRHRHSRPRRAFRRLSRRAGLRLRPAGSV